MLMPCDNVTICDSVRREGRVIELDGLLWGYIPCVKPRLSYYTLIPNHTGLV